MNTILITTPNQKDVDTIVKWGRENRELWASEDEAWYSKEALTLWINNPQDDIILGAYDNEKIVGMCLVHGMREWAYCPSVFVEKQYRGNGIGKMLLDKAVEMLAEQGVTELALVVEEDNVVAQKFYKKVGFSPGFRFIWMSKKSRKQ